MLARHSRDNHIQHMVMGRRAPTSSATVPVTRTKSPPARLVRGLSHPPLPSHTSSAPRGPWPQQCGSCAASRHEMRLDDRHLHTHRERCRGSVSTSAPADGAPTLTAGCLPSSKPPRYPLYCFLEPFCITVTSSSSSRFRIDRQYLPVTSLMRSRASSTDSIVSPTISSIDRTSAFA